MKIIALLDAGKLQGKIILANPLPFVDILMLMPLRVRSDEPFYPFKLSSTPRLRFAWHKQLTKRKHLYKLQEIL